jgi:hypothetical protein
MPIRALPLIGPGITEEASGSNLEGVVGFGDGAGEEPLGGIVGAGFRETVGIFVLSNTLSIVNVKGNL